MNESRYQFEDLLTVQGIIEAAADATLNVYFGQSTATLKHDGSIVTDADIAMQAAMMLGLHEHYPEVLLLGEENTHEEQLEVMQSGRDYWCLDPLDGTNNYHNNLPLFSVSLALISHNEIVMGIVYDPVRQDFFSALKGQGLWVNGNKAIQPEQPLEIKKAIAFVDFKRLNIDVKSALIEQAPYKSQRNIGTCALEWAWLAAGRVQLILHGSEKLWDYAAGNLLVTEAGGCSETIEGEAVFNSTLSPRSVIAATNASLFGQWTTWIRRI